jgi:putative transposase
MARLARVVAPEVPHHITHRGNRREPVFFNSRDRFFYKELLAQYARNFELEIWAYCLMTNHIHLIATAHFLDSLAKTMCCVQGQFARYQNRLYKWSGHLWENRFYSTPLDSRHLWAAVRYVEMNPVRASLVKDPAEYEWSSARAHISELDDPLLSPTRPFPGPIEDWSDWLTGAHDRRLIEALRRNTKTGRPSGSDSFTSSLESLLARNLRPGRRGRMPGK